MFGSASVDTPQYDALNPAQQRAVRHTVLQSKNMKQLGTEQGALTHMLEEIAGDQNKLADAVKIYGQHRELAIQKARS